MPCLDLEAVHRAVRERGQRMATLGSCLTSAMLLDDGDAVKEPVAPVVVEAAAVLSGSSAADMVATLDFLFEHKEYFADYDSSIISKTDETQVWEGVASKAGRAIPKLNLSSVGCCANDEEGNEPPNEAGALETPRTPSKHALVFTNEVDFWHRKIQNHLTPREWFFELDERITELETDASPRSSLAEEHEFESRLSSKSSVAEKPEVAGSGISGPKNHLPRRDCILQLDDRITELESDSSPLSSLAEEHKLESQLSSRSSVAQTPEVAGAEISSPQPELKSDMGATSKFVPRAKVAVTRLSSNGFSRVGLVSRDPIAQVLCVRHPLASVGNGTPRVPVRMVSAPVTPRVPVRMVSAPTVHPRCPVACRVPEALYDDDVVSI
mmetsp:Transcript_22940/g.48749  ORF Transcript_22940/g.48749 Transcript_22940/m.48749 type:complete len:382 (+) Transcript_22940:1-1146(+)